jgi:hypothetical protein
VPKLKDDDVNFDSQLPHIHYIKGGGTEGSEVKGLIPGRKYRPDSYVPDPSGATKGSVYLYHGNKWHGYPPEHAGHQTYLHTGIWAADAYEATIEVQKLYVEHGYRVFVVWAHEFAECERKRCPRDVREVCREFTVES